MVVKIIIIGMFFFDVPSDTELVTYSSTEASIIGTKVKASNVSYNSNVLSGDSISFEDLFYRSILRLEH